MTTLYQEKTRCSLCGSENEYDVIGSTNAFGSADLDTRPPEMKRSTIFAWVQRCPECGYCASNVSKSRPGLQAMLKRKEYKRQLIDPEYPELANSFLCKAIVDQEAGDYAAATWALIHSAWVCDDSDRSAQAKVCRTKAAKMLLIAEKHGQKMAGQEGGSTALLADLLRRAGQSKEARKLIAERRGGITEDIIAQVLDFETTLLDKNDVSCHTIAEAEALGCDVLIVEDEPSFVELIREMIRRRFPNLKVQSAKDGLEGFEKARASKPRIVWTGLRMPRMDGLQMIELIRQDPALQNTRIILCTADFTRNVKKRALDLRVEKLFPKPFKIEEALSAIADCLLERHENRPRKVGSGSQKVPR